MNKRQLNLNIVDEGIEYYRIVPDQKYFCTMWDTNSVDVVCIRPELESSSQMVIQFYDIRKQLIASYDVDENGYLPSNSIGQRITQFPFIYISVYFMDTQNNYIKNSELLRMDLSYSMRPRSVMNISENNQQFNTDLSYLINGWSNSWSSTNTNIQTIKDLLTTFAQNLSSLGISASDKDGLIQLISKISEVKIDG